MQVPVIVAARNMARIWQPSCVPEKKSLQTVLVAHQECQQTRLMLNLSKRGRARLIECSHGGLGPTWGQHPPLPGRADNAAVRCSSTADYLERSKSVVNLYNICVRCLLLLLKLP